MPQDGSGDEIVFASVEDLDWLPPEINTGVAHSARVYNYLLGGQAGIRQFLDIGTGIRAVGNTHEVAQAVAPGSRIVYLAASPEAKLRRQRTCRRNGGAGPALTTR
jgi:hypothetical protein